MSASREKQARQNLVDSGWVDPKLTREADQKKKDKHINTLYAIIAVLFVVAVIAGIIWNSNTIQKNSTAVTIDGEKYTAAEVNFYYQNTYSGFVNTYYSILSYINFDPSLSLKGQTLNDTAAAMLETDAGITWHDYLMDEAIEEMTAIQNANKMAEDEGFVYPEEVQLQHESAITSLNALAASNGLSVDAYLANMFGSAMPAEVYEKELLNTLQYEAYVTAHADSLTYTVDKLEEAYQLSPNNYDRVSYEYLTLAWKVDSTTDADGNKVELTEEEKTAAADAAEKTINELFAKYENGTALALMADEEAGIYYVQDDSAAYSSSDIASLWLFDEAREAGDCEIVTGPSAYYIVKLRERFREDYNTVNVRHVLLQPAAGTLSSDDPAYEAEQESLNADAKAKAESLLAEWKAGAATEDTFAQMAMDYSSDSSSIYGGLYSRIHQGQMVTEFEDWCFDSSRKAGDVGIVETVYGYHIMYFCGEDLPSWQALVTEDLSNEDAFAFIDSLSTGSTVERHNFGMKFVG